MCIFVSKRLPRIFTYSNSGFTHKAKLLGKVQGVVVQAIKETSGSSTKGNEMVTLKEFDLKT